MAFGDFSYNWIILNSSASEWIHWWRLVRTRSCTSRLFTITTFSVQLLTTSVFCISSAGRQTWLPPVSWLFGNVCVQTHCTRDVCLSARDGLFSSHGCNLIPQRVPLDVWLKLLSECEYAWYQNGFDCVWEDGEKPLWLVRSLSIANNKPIRQ